MIILIYSWYSLWFLSRESFKTAIVSQIVNMCRNLRMVIFIQRSPFNRFLIRTSPCLFLFNFFRKSEWKLWGFEVFDYRANRKKRFSGSFMNLVLGWTMAQKFICNSWGLMMFEALNWFLGRIYFVTLYSKQYWHFQKSSFSFLVFFLLNLFQRSLQF